MECWCDCLHSSDAAEVLKGHYFCHCQQQLKVAGILVGWNVADQSAQRLQRESLELPFGALCTDASDIQAVSCFERLSKFLPRWTGCCGSPLGFR